MDFLVLGLTKEDAAEFLKGTISRFNVMLRDNGIVTIGQLLPELRHDLAELANSMGKTIHVMKKSEEPYYFNRGWETVSGYDSIGFDILDGHDGKGFILTLNDHPIVRKESL